MEAENLKELAKLIAEELKQHQDCQLTPEEQASIRSLLNTKKNAVKTFIWIVGALMLWMLKDVYNFIIKHLGWQ